MAKPQLEDGHTQIANETLEQLMKLHLSPNQWQVLLCVIRKTYGFHKKVDHIANSQIVNATGLCKAVVSRCLHRLVEMELITRNGRTTGFQKDWERWQGLAEQSTVSSSANQSLQNSQLKLAEQSTKVSSPAVTQKKKDTYTKETLQKKERKRVYGEFQNVHLTDAEHQKLEAKFGTLGAAALIETLSGGKASKGYKYTNDYAAILNWDRRDKKNAKPRRGNQPLSRNEDYQEPPG